MTRRTSLRNGGQGRLLEDESGLVGQSHKRSRFGWFSYTEQLNVGEARINRLEAAVPPSRPRRPPRSP
jgi:hypothetical protein